MRNQELLEKETQVEEIMRQVRIAKFELQFDEVCIKRQKKMNLHFEKLVRKYEFALSEMDDACAEWIHRKYILKELENIEQSGYSRATFYRLKRLSLEQFLWCYAQINQLENESIKAAQLKEKQKKGKQKFRSARNSKKE